jgi:PAS domain S-box-containing protein
MVESRAESSSGAKRRTLEEQGTSMLRVVATAFTVFMVGAAVFEMVGAAVEGAARTAGSVGAGVSAVCGLLAWGSALVVQRGRYLPAAWMLVLALAAKAFLTAALSPPGQLALLAPLYVVPIVMCQVLLGSRSAAGVTAGSVLMFVVAYARLPADFPADTVPLVASASLLLYLLIGSVVHVTLSRMTQALRRADHLLATTERARSDLREREEQFRALAESSATGIVIHQDGHLVYGNPHFSGMAHVPHGDVFGLSLWDFFDRAGAEALQAQLVRRRTLATRATAPEQLLFRPLKGPARWCQVAVAEAVFRQKPAIVANVLDVTELVEAQLEVKRERDFSSNVINTADAIIMVLDPEGKVLMISPTGERLTGYAADELRGRPFWEKVTVAERLGEAAAMLEALRAEPRGEAETTWQNRAGDDLIVAWRWVSQYDPEGQLSGVVVIGLDVTQQRVLERQSMVTERLRALGQVAGGVAHDLNNMLAGIMGPADLMLLDEEDPENQHSLNAIMAAARRGAETVKRIQRFAQARTELDRQEFDLRQLVEDVVFALRPRWRDGAQRQGISMKVTNEVPEGLKVLASSGEIGNVLTNLIVNACEAMPTGGLIAITGHASAAEVVFEVTDDGTGMAPETVAQIFQPFFSTKGADNSGLGLAVIRGIILRHGGSIEVSSELGVGTTFTISLPAATESVEQAVASDDRGEPMDRLRILIVDDMADLREYMSRVMQRLGHEALAVVSGEEALRQLQAARFDILVTDYGMEEMAGPDLAERARLIQPHLRMILMTGWDVDLSDFAGFGAVLQKPFTRDQIIEALESLETPAAAT